MTDNGKQHRRQSDTIKGKIIATTEKIVIALIGALLAYYLQQERHNDTQTQQQKVQCCKLQKGEQKDTQK